MMQKIYIIAGENSGDFIASNLIQNLRKECPSTFLFRGIGGAKMVDKGISMFAGIETINLMGFVEILPKILELRTFINDTIQDIIFFEPQLLITIDSPGFTYRVAKKIRSALPNLKIAHIIAPSVWAYNPGRARKYADIYDHLFTILPFEAPYFEKEGLCCTYIGHPIFEQSFFINKNEILPPSVSHKVNICVTPGSRLGEIKRHMPIFAKALDLLSKTYPFLQVVFVLANKKHEAEITKFLPNISYNFSFSYDKLDSFAAADIALAKSGTNTIEIAASGTTMVVGYRINKFSFWFLKSFLKIKYASLVNIIAGREIIPEFIQNNCTSENIAAELQELLENPDARKAQIHDLKEILSTMQVNINPTLIAAKTLIKEFF